MRACTRSMALPPDRERVLNDLVPEVRRYAAGFATSNDKTRDVAESNALLAAARALREYDPGAGVPCKAWVFLNVKRRLRRTDSHGRSAGRARREEGRDSQLSAFKDKSGWEPAARDPEPDETPAILSKLRARADARGPLCRAVVDGLAEGLTQREIGLRAGVPEYAVCHEIARIRKLWKGDFCEAW